MGAQKIRQPGDQRNGTEGWVYVLSNQSMPGMLKIGITKRDPQQRARELSGSTGVPTPFVVEHCRFVADCRATEKVMHRQLDRYRVGKNREFFQMPLADAIRALDEAARFERTVTQPPGGCISSTINLGKWLLFWPVLGPIWLWKRGLWGKAAAVFMVFLLLAAIFAQDPQNETSIAATATAAALVPLGTVVTLATVESLASQSEAATATASAPTETPIPPTQTPAPSVATSLPTNTPLPSATPTPVGGVRVINAANLRSGPGTGFEAVGNAQPGDVLIVTGRNAIGDWYELQGGAWIAAFLVEGAAADVPLAGNIPTLPTIAPTSAPVVIPATVAPTAPTLAPAFQPPSAQGSSCDCSSDAYNCPSFPSPWDAQACFLRCNAMGVGDIHGLDRDSDGNACEWDS